MRRSGKFRKKYQIEVTETLQKIVEVTAYSPDDAITEITKQYREGEIVLDSGDCIDYSIAIWK